MKRFIIGLTATAVIAAIILFACDKSQVSNAEISAMEEEVLINPANPDNPFDYYGDLHNKSLKVLLNEFPVSQNMNVKKSAREHIPFARHSLEKIVAESNMTALKSSVNLEDDEAFLAALDLLIDDMENNYVNVFESLNLDAKTAIVLKNFHTDLLGMFENEDFVISDVFDKIIDFESKIINNTTPILINEKELVLGSTSTLRHSISFWMEELDINEDDLEVRLKRKPILGWFGVLFNVGFGDLTGFLIGFPAGGPLGGTSGACIGSWAVYSTGCMLYWHDLIGLDL